MRIATWNLEWAGPRRQRSAREQLERHRADVVVTTEDHARPWLSYPYAIDAGSEWGYPAKSGRRKVVAWSRTPWRHVDVATPGAARGRLVVDIAAFDETELTVVGVCIPWAAAHVNTGRADRRRWEEHVEFCEILGDVLDDLRRDSPIVVAGDFNQRVPRHRQPIHVWEALCNALRGFDIASGGDLNGVALIDHIALFGAAATEIRAWPRIVDGQRLSDHDGVYVDIAGARRP